MKKIIAILVLFILTVWTSFAAVKSQIDAANFLASEWIITDQSGNPDNYRLSDTITRKEVMKVVMKLSVHSVSDTCRWEFSDVANDWGCKYIEAALDAWYIATNNTFRPDDNITLTEAMKLIQKSKWVQKIQQTDNWQEDYMMTAYEYGIIEDKYYNYNDDATRGWIFQIATSTIEKEEEIIEAGGIISDEAM